MLDLGAEMDAASDGVHLALKTGGGLIDAPGYLDITVGVAHIKLLNSRAYVVKSGDAVTAAAVLHPLLYEIAGAAHLLPAGYQVQIKSDGTTSVYAIPSVWLSRFATRGDIVVPHDAPASSIISLLQAARTDDRPDITALLSVAEGVDPALPRLAALSLLPSMSLLSSSDQALLIRALFASDDASHEIVPVLVRQVFVDPSVTPDNVLTTWSDLAMQSAASKPTEMLTLMTEVNELPAELDAAGYPKQSRLWKDAFHSVSDILSPLLSPGDRARLAQNQSDATTQTASLSEPMPPVHTLHLSKDELIARTRVMLDTHGVLFTQNTTLTQNPNDDQSVDVKDVFVAEQGSDIPYALTFTPEVNLLSHIIRSGVELPNAVAVGAFFKD